MAELPATGNEQQPMLQRIRGILVGLGFYGLWGALAAILALALYQLHVTLVFLGILLVENPSTRPAGWSSTTITGLSRFLILILGAVWLMTVSFLEGYLREGSQQRTLRTRVLRLLLIVGAIFGMSYVILLLLS